jgi:hypothetical protein
LGYQEDDMQVTDERPITDDERKQFRVYLAQGLGALGFTNREAEPDEVVEAIGAFIEQWRVERQKPLARFLLKRSSQVVDVGISLGMAWGYQMVRTMEWEWVCVKERGQDFYALVSKDRAYLVYPTYWMREILQDPTKENTTVSLFARARAGELPESSDQAYLHID